ncbi:class I SAM-dependent methyltransferase [soil metagenome]
MSARGPWRTHALQWSRVGPPLRPSPEDVAVAGAAIDGWRGATGRDDPTLLLLGVTPELCALPTGPQSRMLAVDRSLDMIRGVWPGRLRPADAAMRADWLRLPIGAGSVDIALSDGCLSTLPFPGGYAEACAELLRVLRGGGRVIARCFVLPDTPERVDDVLADLRAARCGGFHAFKWRLVMALQPDPEIGVRLADVWDALHAQEGDLASMAERCGWRVEEVRTIEAYRGVQAQYSFPALADLRALFTEAGLAVLDVARPAYELGDRCPTLVLAPTSIAARAARG